MLQKHRARRRHNLIMATAKRLLDPAYTPRSSYAQEPEAEPADLIALAFGLHQIRLDQGEAAEYLNAALVDSGNRRRPDFDTTP